MRTSERRAFFTLRGAVENPVVHTPEKREAKVARVKDLKQAIAFAAVGHAATLYEARCALLSADASPPPGHTAKYLRFTNARCKSCNGLGIAYVLDPAKVVITIAECRCVQYEVQYVKAKDPAKENAMPQRVGGTSPQEA